VKLYCIAIMAVPPGSLDGQPAGAGSGETGLPALPSLDLVLPRAEAEPGSAAARLAAIMLQAVRAALPDFHAASHGLERAGLPWVTTGRFPAPAP
jgi:hypothetical protein